MSNNLQYNIYPEKQLIVEIYDGDVAPGDVISQKKTIWNDHLYKDTYNLIMDFRRSNFLFCKSDVYKMVDFIKSFKGNTSGRKVAVLVDTPKQTALVSLFAMNTKEFPLDVHIYSTLQAACNLDFLSSESYKYYEELIMNLSVSSSR